MTEFLGEGREDQTLDEGKELTGLEYEATRRQLTAEEQQRVAELRQDAGRIVSTERDKATENDESDVAKGDDSP